MMARHIQTSEKYKKFNKVYIFCNTGMERKETFDFLKNIIKFWKIPLIMLEGVYSKTPKIGVKSKIVNFDNVDMKGKVFTKMIEQMNKYENKGVPNQAIPYCSDYLKVRVSHDYCREHFQSTKYIKAIGYRLEDMPKRITFAELKADKTRIAPLLTDFEIPINNLLLNDFFNKEPFKLGIHSKFGNCELCWKKSDNLLIETLQYGTRFIEWHKKEEEKYGNTFFREKKTINQLVKISKLGTQIKMFKEEEEGCVCSF